MRHSAGKLEDNGNASVPEDQPTLNNHLPADGAEWIEFFVREMMVATSVDDARARAARMLEVLEKSISERARAEATDALQKVLILKPFKIHVIDQTLMFCVSLSECLFRGTDQLYDVCCCPGVAELKWQLGDIECFEIGLFVEELFC